MRISFAAAYGAMMVGFFTLGSAAMATPPKDVRDALKELKVDDVIKTSNGDVKKACGCAVKMSVDQDSYKSAADVGTYLPDAFKNFAEATQKYCTDAPAKKAFCSKVKSLHVKYKKETSDVTFARGDFTATTDGAQGTYPTTEQYSTHMNW